MKQLWAPWRMTYIDDTAEKKDEGCFFCRAWQEKGAERSTLLLTRSDNCLVMLNRYPYTSAHIMIAPARHIGVVEETTADEGGAIWSLVARSKQALSKALSPDGFNIGINQGKVAGAGVLDHLHVHIVPRWNGDVNFMPVFADVRVIPQALEETWEKLRPYFAEF